MSKAENIIKIGSRYNNKKRSYLLVNTIQAKHIPARPAESLELFSELGRKIRNEYPKAHFTIGFAETATAIAAQVSAELGGVYINTTREEFIPENKCICFREEHSHAVNQKLYIEKITEYLPQTDEIVLIDDEISTGRTLYNIIQAMRTEVPELCGRKFVVGSVINRLTPERIEFFRESNIYFVSVFNVSWTDAELERNFTDLSAPPEFTELSPNVPDTEKICIPDSRTFCNIVEYISECRKIADIIAEKVDFSGMSDVLFIGTEECMFPSVISAGIIEERFNVKAYCHSTTRSPVCISQAENYPMQNGFRICSLYDTERVNYIYNLRQYDAVILISDSANPDGNALKILDGIFRSFDIKQRFYFTGA